MTIESEFSLIQQNQWSKLLAVLVNLFGSHNLDMAEDVLQDAFYKAWLDWKQSGIPDNPNAWLLKVAKNTALDKIRQTRTHTKYSQEFSAQLDSEWTMKNTVDNAFQSSKIKDDQLRMLFSCCQHQISAENRLAFMLKHLCGLSIRAIASAILVSEQTVKKRLFRTKQRFQRLELKLPEPDALPEALDSVHTALYLLFNEGFHTSQDKLRIDLMFCKEALGLMSLLTDEAEIANQDTFGLRALMHFHIARAESKVSHQGFNIPIDLQDRTLWRHDDIFKGNRLLGFASAMSKLGTGRFYFEARIAQQHCNAEDFDSTNWHLIVKLYDELIEITQSPIAELNQAVAIGYAGSLQAAIERVATISHQATAISKTHFPDAVSAHLWAKLGNKEKAACYAAKAMQKGGTHHENKIMLEQIERLLGKAKAAAL